jgi:hypothetical protein
MKAPQPRRDEILPRARELDLLTEPVTDWLDEIARLQGIGSTHVEQPDPVDVPRGADPVEVARRRIEVEDANRLTKMVQSTISSARGVADRNLKLALAAESDTIIEGPIRDLAGKLVSKARPLATALTRWSPDFDADQVHNAGTPAEIKAHDQAYALAVEWQVLVSLWQVLVIAPLSPNTPRPSIGAHWWWVNPEATTGHWEERSDRGSVRNLLLVASQPEEARFRFASLTEAKAIVSDLQRAARQGEPRARARASF